MSGRQSPETISVVMATFNGARTLPDQLEALAGQTYGGRWELIAVDNGSADGSPDIVRSFSSRLPAVSVTTATEQRGAPYARNLGASMAMGSLLAFCDQDDVVDPGWLKALAAAAPEADLVGGAIDLKAINDPVTLSWYPEHWIDNWEGWSRPPQTKDYLPFVITANSAVWPDVFRDVGGFDNRFARGGEDIVFSWSAQLAGYRLGWAPKAVIHKRLRASIGSLARQTYWYGRGATGAYRKFRDRGAPRTTIRSALKGWAWLIVHLPDLVRSRRRRGAWMARLGLRTGFVVGSIRNRVLYI